MQTQALNENWQVRQQGLEEWLPAQVPGSIHTDLMANKRLPDPFYGTQEEQVQWVAEKGWVYRRFFYPQPGMLAHERIYLVCEGLDTLAEVRLNDRILGTADNMFRTWRWDVTEMLKDGENRLEILFRSSLAYIRGRRRSAALPELCMGIAGGAHLRKAPSHFGWDWGPRLPCVGIWRGIRLEGCSRGRILQTRFEQAHESERVILTTRVQCDLWGPESAPRVLRLRITTPDRQTLQVDAPARPQQTIPVTITNPQLWWPNGLGQQALYQVEIELLEDAQEAREPRQLDGRSCEIGLRTIELRQEDDQHGKSFTFFVNGVRLFVKGSNWIPADSFPARVTSERMEHLIRSAAESHQNMLRVWGGGYYEDDVFYTLCDRYGLLVWQDFLFACATYPLTDPDYVNSICGEVEDNVRRLRHHACLALWSGNNEIEWMSVMMGWNKQHGDLAAAYERFFFHTLPDWLAVEDPGRPYWPSSPSSNDPFNHPNCASSGDAHLWEVYHQYKPPRFYRQQNPRFVSEFGFQSLPALATLESFAPQERWQLSSREMRCHQRAMAGNSKLVWYLAQRFRLPRIFPDLAYLSQVFQAEAVRTGVEHWRRHPEQTSGALYWQLNDCWPVISWSSIDYSGRWKALHYAARRFFAPLALSIEDEVTRGKKQMAVWLVNDSRAGWQGSMRWTLETLDGEMLKGGEQPAQAAASSANCLIRLDFAKKGERKQRISWDRVVFTAELWQGETLLARQVTPFVPEKAMPLTNPGLESSVRVVEDQLVIEVYARRLARFVELALDGADVRFSDNFFDLPAGRSVTVTCPLPAGWTAQQARERLCLRSLHATGPCYPAPVARWKGLTALAGSLVEVAWIAGIRPRLDRAA